MYLGDKAGPPTRKPRPRGDLKSVLRQWRGGAPFISKWLVGLFQNGCFPYYNSHTSLL